MKSNLSTSRWFNVWLLVVLLALAPVASFGATTTKMQYGTSNQALTMTLTAVTNNTYWGATAVDNSTNLFIDVFVHIKVKTGTVAGTPVWNVYAAGTADGGTTYTDSASGTNAAQTPTNPPNLKFVGVCNTPASTVTYNCDFSLAQAFGGVLPDHWQLIAQNVTGATSDATIGSAWYQGVYAQNQ